MDYITEVYIESNVFIHIQLSFDHPLKVESLESQIISFFSSDKINVLACQLIGGIHYMPFRDI